MTTQELFTRKITNTCSTQNLETISKELSEEYAIDIRGTLIETGKLYEYIDLPLTKPYNDIKQKIENIRSTYELMISKKTTEYDEKKNQVQNEIFKLKKTISQCKRHLLKSNVKKIFGAQIYSTEIDAEKLILDSMKKEKSAKKKTLKDITKDYSQSIRTLEKEMAHDVARKNYKHSVDVISTKFPKIDMSFMELKKDVSYSTPITKKKVRTPVDGDYTFEYYHKIFSLPLFAMTSLNEKKNELIINIHNNFKRSSSRFINDNTITTDISSTNYGYSSNSLQNILSEDSINKTPYTLFIGDAELLNGSEAKKTPFVKHSHFVKHYNFYDTREQFLLFANFKNLDVNSSFKFKHEQPLIIPEKTKQRITYAKPYFDEIFLVSQADWKLVSASTKASVAYSPSIAYSPIDPLVIGRSKIINPEATNDKDRYSYHLIDVFNPTALEEYVESTYVSGKGGKN